MQRIMNKDINETNPINSFINCGEYALMIVKFIGSDDYKRILDNIQDTKEAGFITGLSISSTLMMTKCPIYYKKIDENSEEDKSVESYE